ncbi:MAG: serine/threonine protein kinase, partial [Acidobacteria bacterium]|nr:serine/threonine protein kinase [Acidobacteriota bacterium]
GMGAVYRARRTLLGDEVAIKVVLGDHGEGAARDRFLRESRVAASLRHPSIVSIFDFDMPPGGQPYLVMELLSGPSLREELDSRRRMDLDDLHRIIPGICAALQLAHSHDVVHRDIKPANIVAHHYHGGQRVYKLVDFGIANLRQNADETRLTATHQFLGTVSYASPEQLTGRAVDGRADVYSLSAVLFEMLTGKLPFASDGDFLATVSAQLAEPAPRVRILRPDLPAWIEDVLAKGLAKEPDARWQSAEEFGAALLRADAPANATTVVSGPVAAGLAATYDVGERLGSGRLGSEVFRGTHRALGHPVAIRILRPGSHPNWNAAKERFLREAKALQVAHESVIQVREYGEEAGLVYIVTDYINGPSVRGLLSDTGRLEWPRLKPLLANLLEAARVLHRRKALLTGLSPEIMRVRLPDLEAGEDSEQLLISTTGIWSAQDLLATLNEKTVRGVSLEDVELRYVAPELLTGGTVDVRSDVFTLGVVIYEMATGGRPFDGGSMPELLGRMLSGMVVVPTLAAPELPPEVAGAIMRALRPAPADRFANVKQFATALTVSPVHG